MKDFLRHKLFVEKDGEAEARYIKNRLKKAEKIKSVINDFGKHSGTLLDIGCSLGIMTDFLRKDFEVNGIDVDDEAVLYARSKWPGIKFDVMSADNTSFKDNTFDVAVCSGIYEHVKDAGVLINEIYRILKPGGICYFTAMNKFIPIEPHYKLPFLSYLPKPLADSYLRLFKGKSYDVKAYTLGKLKKLVSRFEVFDYTEKIIADPERFKAQDVVKKNSFAQRAALFITRNLYYIVPTYVWVLKKKQNSGAKDEADNTGTVL